MEQWKVQRKQGIRGILGSLSLFEYVIIAAIVLTVLVVALKGDWKERYISEHVTLPDGRVVVCVRDSWSRSGAMSCDFAGAK